MFPLFYILFWFRHFSLTILLCNKHFRLSWLHSKKDYFWCRGKRGTFDRMEFFFPKSQFAGIQPGQELWASPLEVFLHNLSLKCCISKGIWRMHLGFTLWFTWAGDMLRSHLTAQGSMLYHVLPFPCLALPFPPSPVSMTLQILPDEIPHSLLTCASWLRRLTVYYLIFCLVSSPLT